MTAPVLCDTCSPSGAAIHRVGNWQHALTWLKVCIQTDLR